MYPEPTELLLIGCLTELIWTQKFKSSMSRPKTNLQTCWQKRHFTRDEWNNLLHLLNISHFSLLCCAQNFSLTSCTKTMAKRMQAQEGAESICVEKPGDTQSTMSNRLVKYRETCRKRTQWRRSVEFARMAKRCSSGRRYEETRRDRRRPGTPELSWRFGTRRFRKRKKLCNPRQWQSFATQSPYINKLRAAHGEGFLDRETEIWSQPDGSNEERRCEHSFLVYIYVCHSSSCSSSWQRLHRKSAIYRESTQEIFATVISSNSEVDHGSDRNHWYYYDLIGSSQCGERDDSVNWQSCSVCNRKNPTSFLTQCFVWEVSELNPVKAWESKINWFLETRYLKDLDRIDGSRWSSSGKPSQDSLHWEFINEIQKMMTESKCEPEQFKGVIIFVSPKSGTWCGRRPRRPAYSKLQNHDQIQKQFSRTLRHLTVDHMVMSPSTIAWMTCPTACDFRGMIAKDWWDRNVNCLGMDVDDDSWMTLPSFCEAFAIERCRAKGPWTERVEAECPLGRDKRTNACSTAEEGAGSKEWTLGSNTRQ